MCYEYSHCSFCVSGLYLGVKLFVIDYFFNRYPRLKRKRDTVYKIWLSLPTDVEKEKRSVRSEIDKVSKLVIPMPKHITVHIYLTMYSICQHSTNSLCLKGRCWHFCRILFCMMRNFLFLLDTRWKCSQYDYYGIDLCHVIKLQYLESLTREKHQTLPDLINNLWHFEPFYKLHDLTSLNLLIS